MFGAQARIWTAPTLFTIEEIKTPLVCKHTPKLCNGLSLSVQVT